MASSIVGGRDRAGARKRPGAMVVRGECGAVVRRGDAMGVVAARGGAVSVSEVQRARILDAALRVVCRYGYEGMTVARVAGGAGVSRRTFYELFDDREDCFVAVFGEALARVSERVGNAYGHGGRGGWSERVRGALGELLVFLDEDPVVASLLVIDALGAGPRVLECRARALAQVATVLHQEGSRAGGVRDSASGGGMETVGPLTGEGVVGAVFGVIHNHISQGEPGSTVELVNPLMAIVVLPYLGRAAARRELQRPMATDDLRHDRDRADSCDADAGNTDSGGANFNGVDSGGAGSDPLAGLPIRTTYRTLRVVCALTEHPGASNRMVAELAAITDQGQTSKLLARLKRLGLLVNTGAGHMRGGANAWHLTSLGVRVADRIANARTGTTGAAGARHQRNHGRAA